MTLVVAPLPDATNWATTRVAPTAGDVGGRGFVRLFQSHQIG